MVVALVVASVLRRNDLPCQDQWREFYGKFEQIFAPTQACALSPCFLASSGVCWALTAWKLLSPTTGAKEAHSLRQSFERQPFRTSDLSF